MRALQNIELEPLGRTALVRISRESKLNALNDQTMRELVLVLDEVEENPAYRGMILTGAALPPSSDGAR